MAPALHSSSSMPTLPDHHQPADHPPQPPFQEVLLRTQAVSENAMPLIVTFFDDHEMSNVCIMVQPSATDGT